MSDEQSLEELAPVEVEQEVESVEADADVNETTDDELESTEESATDEDDSEEVELNGNKYKIPKELKDAFLMQQDYTKKTQEVAEARREFEAQQTAFKQQAEFQQAHLNEIVKFNTLQSQLSQFQNLDWNALYDADPVEAMKLDRQYSGLKEEFTRTQATIQQAERYQALQQQQEQAKLLEQSRVTLANEFKDWSPQIGKEVGEYLKTYSRAGINDQVLKDIDAGLYGALPIVLARKAQLYDQMIKKASVKPTAPPPKPVTKVGTKATASVNPDDMSMDEWVKWRNKKAK